MGGLGLLLLALAWANPSLSGGQPAPRPRIEVWSGGSWCWFAGPRAVRIREGRGTPDKVFAGWIGWGGQVTIGAYDAASGVSTARVVGHLTADDHGSPAILVEPDHRLTVFWSGHNGSEMYYRSTITPADIAAWGPVLHLPSGLTGGRGFTYPNPQRLSGEDNRTYLFFRGADWSADYATRARDGRWSRTRRLVVQPGQRPYMKVGSNGVDTIAFAFTNGHPRELTTSIYYAAYRHGWLRHASGRRITGLARAPIRPRQADLVYDGRARRISSWIWDVALDRRRRPVIAYATFPSSRNHAYWYARWNGRRWASHFLAYAGPSISPGTIEQQYSGGMALDAADPSVVYLSRKVDGRFQIERWSTPNGGYRWHHSIVVRDGVDDMRPVVPDGPGGDGIRLLWLQGRYGSFTSYRTSIAFLR
ncbi:MAG: hypothetical protein QOD66_3848 [Solirubrobacteraceae bacterium]|jgi:hypothetical protein|nr:hypothetical protein [Solirubrobacteraceae bacterium]